MEKPITQASTDELRMEHVRLTDLIRVRQDDFDGLMKKKEELEVEVKNLESSLEEKKKAYREEMTRERIALEKERTTRDEEARELGEAYLDLEKKKAQLDERTKCLSTLEQESGVMRAKLEADINNAKECERLLAKDVARTEADKQAVKVREDVLNNMQSDIDKQSAKLEAAKKISEDLMAQLMAQRAEQEAQKAKIQQDEAALREREAVTLARSDELEKMLEEAALAEAAILRSKEEVQVLEDRWHTELKNVEAERRNLQVERARLVSWEKDIAIQAAQHTN